MTPPAHIIQYPQCRGREDVADEKPAVRSVRTAKPTISPASSAHRRR